MPSYHDWQQPGPREIWLDGEFLLYTSFQWSPASPGAVAVRTLAGGHVVQRIYRGLTAPSSLRPWRSPLVLDGFDETAYHAFAAASERGGPVRLFAGWPWVDVWDASTGQQQFSTSRLLPYGTVPGVTSGTHPARAWLNGVEQAVVYGSSPSPTSGQVGVVTSALAQNRAVRTPALAAADVLVVRYYPLQEVLVTATHGNPDVGLLTASYELEEVLRGSWS